MVKRMSPASVMLLMVWLWSVEGKEKVGSSAGRVIISPAPPPGNYDNKDDAIKCFKYEGEQVDCPVHTNREKFNMSAFMQECLDQEQEDLGVSCNFFPLQPPMSDDAARWSCHHVIPNVPCMAGFKVRLTHQQRRGGADDAFISVEFYALLPPAPGSKDSSPEYDVAQWLAFGISPRDEQMGDDLVIYCHPYMDRVQFPIDEFDKDMYPEDIGVAINKYFTTGNGKQPFDAERKFSKRQGRVKGGHVEYFQHGKGYWSVIKCRASISSYIILRSKREISTGIDLDMEQVKNAFIFLATGPCLHPRCLGDHKNNTEELAEIARRTTPLGYHTRHWTSNKTIPLYEAAQRNTGTNLGLYTAFLLFNIVLITVITIRI